MSAAQYEICAVVTRDKRSFPWPSFLSGNSVTQTDEKDYQQTQQQQSDKQQTFLQHLQQQDIQHIQQLQQQAYAAPRFAPQHNPNIRYQHNPIRRFQKYNNNDLKPISVSLPPAQLQPSRFTDNSQVHQSDSSPVPPSEVDARKTEYELPAGSHSITQPIPDELRRLAFSLGIHDLSKLPSLDEAMNLLGATTSDETISIIKELASTDNGKEMIKQFLQSSDDDTDAVGKADVEPDQQKLEQLTQQNQLQLTEQHQRLARQNYLPQLIQQQHQVYGTPYIRHPNQLLQPPTFRLQHANTELGVIPGVVKPTKPPSGGFFQAITDFFLPPPDENLKKFQKSADDSTVVPAPTISHSSAVFSYQNPLNPDFRAQHQKQLDQSEQHRKPRHPVANTSSISKIPIQSVNGLNTPFIEGFKSPLPTLSPFQPLPYSFGDELDGAASEHITAVMRAPISNEVETQKNVERVAYRMQKGRNEIEFQPSENEAGFSIQRRIDNKPQRISSYDSYATGKIKRADEEAVRIAIPTQIPQTAAQIR